MGAEDFQRKLQLYGGPDATQQWARLMERIEPLGTAIFGLPPAAVRMDAWAVVTMGRYAPALLRVLVAGGASLEQPFSRILEEERITDRFILNWLNMICFLLQGATTENAPTTLMAYVRRGRVTVLKGVKGGREEGRGGREKKCSQTQRQAKAEVDVEMRSEEKGK